MQPTRGGPPEHGPSDSPTRGPSDGMIVFIIAIVLLVVIGAVVFRCAQSWQNFT